MIFKLEIPFADLPASRIITLDENEFEIKFNYNKRFDFISIEVIRENQIIHTTKLCYGIDIFKNTNLSRIKLIPYSENDLEQITSSNLLVSKETFGTSVFLMYEIESDNLEDEP